MAGGSFRLKEPAATAAIFGASGALFHKPGTGEKSRDSSSPFGRPWRTPINKPAK
jgi:hypothetical protein